MVRELDLRRIVDNGDATAGYMVEMNPNPFFIGYTCEDQKQLNGKVKGETRIPGGGKRYELVINNVLTNLTKAYRERYNWFEFHIMVKDVEGFVGIYLHIGNDDDDTDGCILIGDTQNNIMLKPAIGKPILNSTNAFRRFYERYYPLLKKGDKVFLTIHDEKF